MRHLFTILMIVSGIAAGMVLTRYIHTGESDTVPVVELVSKPTLKPTLNSTLNSTPKPAPKLAPPIDGVPALNQKSDNTNAPLFPEKVNGNGGGNDPGAADARPYEESLPQDVYEPPALKVTAVPVEAESVKPETPSPEAKSVGSEQQTALPAVKPMIAVVIDDMGVDRKRSARIIDLKGPLTLSFLTYAKDLDQQTAQARAKGHELMLHVSMEPGNANLDPGPNALLLELTTEEIIRRLDWGLSRFKGYVGINNHMGSRFTEDRASMAVVLAEIKRRGLLYLDSRTSPKSVGAAVSRKLGVPTVERNIFLDNVKDVDAVLRRLDETERLARRTGSAVAIGHPRDATLKALSTWIADVQARGFVLVPITAIVRHRSSPG